MLTLVEAKRMIADDLLAELVAAIEKTHEVSQYICCVRVNEKHYHKKDLAWDPNFSQRLLIQE